MKQKISTKMISEIGLLIALGVVFKIVTDIVFRTGLSFLFIDLTLLVTVVILYRYPLVKIALMVGFIQMAISAMFFMTTDIWFMRPVIALLGIGFIKLLQKRKWKDQTKFIWSVFLTSKFTVLAVSIVLIIAILFFPNFINYETVMGTFEAGIDEEILWIIEGNFVLLMICAAVLLGLIYAYIPAFANMFIGFLFFKFVGKRIFKEKESISNEIQDTDLK